MRVLLDGPRRYNEMRGLIPDISDRMLSERLRELEEAGVLTRRVLPDAPVRVEYDLTDKGRALEGAIDAIGKWAEQWIPLAAGARGSSVRPPARKAAASRRS